MPDLTVNQTRAADRRAPLLAAAVAACLLLLSLVLYTFAHEGGHALLGLLFGGRLTGFSINFFDLSAYAAIDGDFSPAQRALVSLAGIALPLLLCLAFLLLPDSRDDPVLFTFKTAVFLMAVNTLLAWIGIPLLAAAGRAVNDDSYSFLVHSSAPPLLVAGLALLVYLSCWVFFFRRMGGARSWVSRLRLGLLHLAEPASRRTVLALALTGALVLATAFGLSRLGTAQAFVPPPGYTQVASFDLSQKGLRDEAIYAFTLEAPARVGLSFVLVGVQGAPVNLRLVGPAGAESVFLDLTDPDAHIGRARVNPPPALLPPGAYAVRATLPTGRGRLVLYAQVIPQ